MDDLISRKAAIETAKKMYVACDTNSIDDYAMLMEEALKVLPPAEPQIIRCKDCNFWAKQKDSLQGRCALMGTYPTGNWFCGNAERRTE